MSTNRRPFLDVESIGGLVQSKLYVTKDIEKRTGEKYTYRHLCLRLKVYGVVGRQLEKDGLNPFSFSLCWGKGQS